MSEAIRTPTRGYYLGRKPDTHDVRDAVLRLMRVTREAVGEIDVFAGLSLPVYDQGQIGSCTANAGVLYRRWLAQKFPQFSARDQDLSRLFLYWQERALPWNQSTDTDSGASTRDVCIVLTKTGVCQEADFPYDINNFQLPPTGQAEADAVLNKAGAYHRLPDVDTVISVLVSGYPALLGVTLYPEFELIGMDGVLKMPTRGEKYIGGHEMVIHGYSSERRAFRLQNSWSAAFGDSGHVWMPEAYLEDQDLSSPDMAVVHLGKPWA